MTNAEKYKTAEERAEVFEKFCYGKNCDDCILRLSHCKYSVDACLAFWLDLEAEEEKPLPCMCCGGRMEIHGQALKCTECGFRVSYGLTTNDVTNAYNRVARAVMEAAGERE